MHKILINGEKLTIEEVVSVARDYTLVEIEESAIAKITKAICWCRVKKAPCELK